jgi:hypothetical protein
MKHNTAIEPADFLDQTTICVLPRKVRQGSTSHSFLSMSKLLRLRLIAATPLRVSPTRAASLPP